MEYLVVNWKWNVLVTRDTFEECEDWMRKNPTPGNAYTIVIRRKEANTTFTNEQMDIIHTAFWCGVDAKREGANLVEAYWKMVDQLEEMKKNG